MDYGITAQQLAVICALSGGASLTAAAAEAGVHRNTVHNWRRNSHYFQQALSEAQYDRALHFREKAEALADLALKTIQDLLTDPKTPASVRLRAALAIIQTAVTPPEPKKQVELEFQTVSVTTSPTMANGQHTSPPVHNNAQTVSADPAQSTPAAQSPGAPPMHNPPMHNNAQTAPGATAAQFPDAASVHKNAQTAGSTGAPRMHNRLMHKNAQTAGATAAQFPDAASEHNSAQTPYRRDMPKIGRNDACPCGSGLKFKRCCRNKNGHAFETAA